MAQAKTTPGFTVKMIVAKETKGAIQYKEVDDQGNEAQYGQAKIGTLYVRKSAFGTAYPKAIAVTVAY